MSKAIETPHDRIARHVARLHGGEYRAHKGADIIAPRLIGEVEVSKSKLAEGIRQLQGYRKPRYLVVPDKLVEAATHRTSGLKVGVMDEHGKIVKPAQNTKPQGPSMTTRRGKR